ncbi:phage minor tail protein domain-containing protein [Escherichia coli]
MFLKTEQFEYNGVSVTLSELSALQREMVSSPQWLKSPLLKRALQGKRR